MLMVSPAVFDSVLFLSLHDGEQHHSTLGEESLHRFGVWQPAPNFMSPAELIVAAASFRLCPQHSGEQRTEVRRCLESGCVEYLKCCVTSVMTKYHNPNRI